jgi:hypothetical protein
MPSDVRARARAERQRLAAIAAAERQQAAAAVARRRARVDRLTRWLPNTRGRQTGTLAARRRRQTRLLVALLVIVNVLVWFVEPSWAARAFALVASMLVAPVLYTVLFRKA